MNIQEQNLDQVKQHSLLYGPAQDAPSGERLSALQMGQAFIGESH